MLFLVVGALGALAPVTHAQLVNGVDISHLPVCAQGCLANNTNAAAGCSITDVKCICQSIPYINALSCCLQKQCNPEDQQAALAFDISLCNQYNVSIPDFLGCSPLSVTGSRISLPTGTAGGSVLVSLASTSTVTDVVPLVTTPAGGPVGAFTGNQLLSGTCTNPSIATYTMPNNGLLQLPWVGCSNQRSSCCPYDIKQAGSLSACPSDYITTAGACCPSGWAVYTSTIAGHVPCYTTPALPLVAPSAPTAAAGAPSPSVISNQLFTLRYPLAQPSAALSGGAIAGIVVGSIAGAALIAFAIFFLLRRRHSRASAIRAATVRSQHAREVEPEEFSPTTPKTPGSGGAPSASGMRDDGVSRSATARTAGADPLSAHPSELPSPPLDSPTNRTQWGASGGTTPAMELPGSTFMHEHHPALAGASGTTSPAQVPGAASAESVWRPPFASMERIPSSSGSGKA